MKKIRILLTIFTTLLIINLISCKQDSMKPTETSEVKTLREYYANTAKVNVNSIQYDQAKDEFSMNGMGKISRAKLLIFYGFSKNPPKLTIVNPSPKITK